MNRRQFLLFSGACGVTAGATHLKLSKNFLEKQSYSVGYVDGWFRLLGPLPDTFSKMRSFPNMTAALSALKTGEIQGLLSTPELWSTVRPEILVFNSLSVVGNKQEINALVQDTYPLLQDFYNDQGLCGTLLGLTPALRFRLGRMRSADLENPAQRQNIRTAATGSRALWFEKMGFQVSRGHVFDRLGYQLELVSRGELDLTDAFYPGFISALSEQNFQMNAVCRTGHCGQTLVLDDVTRSPCIVDLLTLKNLRSSSNLADHKHEIAQTLATEDFRQMDLVLKLQKKLELDTQINLPSSLRAEILKCNQVYIQAASLTPDPYRWARSIRKVFA